LAGTVDAIGTLGPTLMGPVADPKPVS